MYIHAKTLDDLLRGVLEKLLKSKTFVSSTRGTSIELDGVLLQLSNPTARLSRTEERGVLFSCLGELLWYLSGSNDLDFITYYIPPYAKESEDGQTVYGGYGSRLFGLRGNDQIKNVLALLKSKPETRRAVIQLFSAEDISMEHIEIPCTCTFQFLIRKNQLHMLTNMRSNDAFMGLSHDIFAFTMVQEILARTLGVSLGKYKHTVGSLHLYTGDNEGASNFLNEGWQENVPMPQMPVGDPWPSIKLLLDAESRIRAGEEVDVEGLGLDPYWADLVRLLQIYRYLKDESLKKVVLAKNQMSSGVYEAYIRSKLSAKHRKQTEGGQLELPVTREI